jgi:glutathione peroxidase
VHVHEDAPDRRAALEQRAAKAAALGAAALGLHDSTGGGGGGIEGGAVLDADAEQAELEAEHLARLQALEDQGHDPHTAAHVAAHIAEQQALPQREGPSLYTANLSAVDIRGNVMRTADLAGKVAIIVNVASNCGFTDANYRGLHRLFERYKAYGLQVIAFPCNQFGEQEPGTHAEIEQFVASHYGVQFPLMSKVEVNGPAAHPLFSWLKQHTPGDETGFAAGEDIRWNFEKFLIDKHGNAVKRYGSDLDYHDLELDVYNELIKF